VHRHCDPVTLPDRAVVWAVSFSEPSPYERDTTPAFGLYVDARWDPPWPHAHLEWPDFGVPADARQARSQLEALLARSRAGEHVEIGCWGGHGRTGTALACLAVLMGCPATDAVAWVRSNYCEDAVETDEQIAFVEQLPAP
jgi:protein-tyrosine phosphatase